MRLMIGNQRGKRGFCECHRDLVCKAWQQLHEKLTRHVLLSVQQLSVRGTVDPNDGCPISDSFALHVFFTSATIRTPVSRRARVLLSS